MAARSSRRDDRDIAHLFTDYSGEDRANGWKREKRSYWSDDPLLAWKGACSHETCRAEMHSVENAEPKRVCYNTDCPWGLKPPPPEKSHLEKRFAGIDFG